MKRILAPGAGCLVAFSMIWASGVLQGGQPSGDPAPKDRKADAVDAAWPRFSGVYPHLAALADSYSECGIGAVVPWADRLWYLSYVSHKAGGGVGLYEITPELEILRRPESVVGTHAGRMIHRESNQLIIGPYLIDRHGGVRVFEDLTSERVTAVMRHLTDPADKVYVQAMEGAFYEADVHTLQARRLFDLSREELGIEGKAHFKGGYTAQGRVVVANNTYDSADQRTGRGGGRLAEWDGNTWKIIHRTAFCDVTTSGGIFGAPSEDVPLWAVGWDRASVLLAVLTGGEWSTYRIPKGSQSYDHAWCTEWPRIREVATGQLMLDMHGLFYTMSADFRAGNTGGLVPLASHLRMTPDFCTWQRKLVLAGNELSSLSHRHRTGGQPQSNLWFGSLEELRRWGKPAGWGGPWYQDEVQAGVPSDPFLIQGFANRVLHIFEGAARTYLPRCTGRFEIVDLPESLVGLDYVTIDRGSMQEPAPPYSFEVNRDVDVYLAVHDRGDPQLPDGWEKTDMKIAWQHGADYTDTVYRRSFREGAVEIPGHDGHNELGHYGVPNTCFVRPASPEGHVLIIANLPADLNGKAHRQKISKPAGGTRIALEIDRQGSGNWAEYATLKLPANGYAYHVFPADLPGRWIRLTADRDTVLTALLIFGSHFDQADGPARARLFESLPSVSELKPRIHGGLLPFAGRLWFAAYVRDAHGQAKDGALHELDKNVRFVKRAESLPGVFANRKMVRNLLSVGPHLIGDDGQIRTLKDLAGEHIVSSIRHPEDTKMYLLTGDGRLLEADLSSLEIVQVANIPKELRLESQGLRFKAGHLAENRLYVAASSADGNSGLLAERDGRRWTILERSPFAEISNLGSMSETVVATGWDRASALLKIRTVGGRWETCRLPKASPAYDQVWTGEWPRIREVVTERMLMDAHGLFYEVSGLPYAWSIRPVAAHRRMISDFCSWRGMLVLAGGHAEAESGLNYVAGPGCGLWLGKTDDLWQLGKPAGRGGPWLETPVRAAEPSEPYLMCDFENKRVELSHDGDRPVKFTIEVDPTVRRKSWQTYGTMTVPAGRRVTHEFPKGFSAHWVRLRVDRECTATAQFLYD